MTDPEMAKTSLNSGIYIGTQYLVYVVVKNLKAALDATGVMADFLSEILVLLGAPAYFSIPGTDIGIPVTNDSGDAFIDPEDLKPDAYRGYEIRLFTGDVISKQVFYARNQSTFIGALMQPFDKFIYNANLGKVSGTNPAGFKTFTKGNHFGRLSDTINIVTVIGFMATIIKFLKNIGLPAAIAKFISLVFNWIYKNNVLDGLDDIDDDLEIVDANLDDALALIKSQMSKNTAERILGH